MHLLWLILQYPEEAPKPSFSGLPHPRYSPHNPETKSINPAFIREGSNSLCWNSFLLRGLCPWNLFDKYFEYNL